MMLAQLPNVLTVLRIVLVPPLVWALLQQAWPLALWLVAAAGVSDALDGWLAKRFGWQSRLGGLLDPLADKLMLAGTFVALWWTGHLPGALLALVLGRDLVILGGALAWHLLVRPLEAAPSLLSKVTTALQLLFALMVLLDLGWWSLPPGLLNALVWLVALSTLSSGLDYVFRLGWAAWRERNSRVSR